MSKPTYHSDRRSDGQVFGHSSTDKIAFYGATPAVRGTLEAAVVTTLSISTTTTKWGYATSTQADSIVTLVNDIRTKLETLGLG